MRPLLHFTPPFHWMNDPNGLIYFNHEYHIFYQHFPYANHWGTMHWGHATTKDFIHFKHHPIALYPSKPFDRNGCFSGSAISLNHQLYLYYTAIQYTSINENNIHIRNNENDTLACQAMIVGNGYQFDNIQNKHIITTDYPQSRDPKAWIGKNEKIYLAIGSHINHVGTVLFYESDDGIHFHYKNKYSNPQIGDMWECPDIFEIDNQYFLMICPENIDTPPKPNCNAIIMPIDFDEDTCTISNVGKYQYLDSGLDFYAPQSFKDENDQVTLLGWMRMRKPVSEQNWVGMLSLPRLLSHQNGHIYQTVHPNVEQLFTKKLDILSFNQPFKLHIQLNENDQLNLGGMILSIENDCLICDRNHVSIHHPKVSNLNATPPLNGHYDLIIYYDYHIFEIYINDGQYVLSQVVYNLDKQTLILPSATYQSFTIEA